MSTADEADIINSASADAAPQAVSPPSPYVKLLRGIKQQTDEGTVWHDEATVRELTGADEEHLASAVKKESGFTEYMNILLSRAVQKIGDLDVQSAPDIVNKLIIADREVLFLALLKATYGNTRDINALCPFCGEKNKITIELEEDFKIKEPDFDIHAPIEVTLSNGDVVGMRLPNGEDMQAIQKKGVTEAESNTIILSRCSSIDGEGVSEKWAQNLNLRDRKTLIEALTQVDIGPDLKGVETQCVECGEDLETLLDWVSLLLS